MPKDIFDIVDTAVKIGLGAFIGGLSSYLISGRQYKQNVELSNINEQKDLIKDISLSYEKAQAGNNKFLSLFSLAINHGEEDLKGLEEKSKRALDESFENIGKAISSANLSQLTELVSLLREYSNTLSKIDALTNQFNTGVPDDASELNPLVARCTDLEKSIYSEISKAYSQYY